MMRGIVITGIAALLTSLNTSVIAANYAIDNPAVKIKNPAGSMYNPASDIKNPAENIYNPANQMDNPNPLSPVTQPIPQAPETKKTTTLPPATSLNGKPQRSIPHKNYHFKTASAYINAAKKAFIQDDYREFLSITEDALRRIKAGTLKASKKTKQKLVNYKVLGYGLLEKNEE